MSELEDDFDIMFGDPKVDDRWMDYALALGRRALGTTAPNPAVGCVLVKDGVLVGFGWTQPGGRPHAETEALRRAGDQARGATAYVTLEPCAHHGKTPPCADALIEAALARVVAARLDPDERVRGLGMNRIAMHGLGNSSWSDHAEAQEDLGGYLSRQIVGRPRVSLKLATSLDGRIATAAGDSQWITGPQARTRGHALRATHDAVLIGIETALADDPQLTCRLPGVVRPTVRIVLDSRGRLPIDSALVRGADKHPLWHVTTPDAAVASEGAPGVSVLRIAAGADGRPDPTAIMNALGERGLNDVLVEGGGQVAASLLQADLVDRLYWFRAGLVLGGDARPGIGALGLAAIADATKWPLQSRTPCGDDLLETYRRVTE